ncbi:MAG: hypothetical protein ACTHOG_10365 [Marmoricola sp.]
MSPLDAPEPRASKLPLIAALVVVVVMLGAGLALGLASHRAHAKAKSAPSYPRVWNPRIAPLAAIASKYRELAFKHPVFVDFMSTKAFDKWVTTDNSDLTSAQKQSAADEEGTLRAQGFISGGVDLLREENHLNGSGILGEYSYQDKRIRVRGTVLTPELKVTLVHELTHVLQDQHFDLEGTFKKLGNSSTEDSWAFDAIVEGDARRIEHKYLNSLPKAVRARIIKTQNAGSTTFMKSVKSVPPFLIADSQAPYDLGEVAVNRAARGGNSAVDRLFEVPPVHEIQLMQPWLLGTHWKDRSFAKPVLAKGEKAHGRSEWGAYYLYQLLAERLAVGKALSIADGWGGDSVLWYGHGTQACARFSLIGRSTSATAAIEAGLRTWASHMGGAARVTRVQATVEMTTCDPGKSFKAGPSHAIVAEQVLTARNDGELYLEKQTPTVQIAICFSSQVAYRLGAGSLGNGPLTAAQNQILAAAARTCRSQ